MYLILKTLEAPGELEVWVGGWWVVGGGFWGGGGGGGGGGRGGGILMETWGWEGGVGCGTVGEG